MARGIQCGLLVLVLAGHASSAGPAPGRSGAGADPDGIEIWSRVLANRFESSIQQITLFSERAGRIQPVRLQMLWRRYGPESRDAHRGVRARLLVRYLAPPELDDTGYLLVDRVRPPDDQFVYLPSLRRIRRLNMRSAFLPGTDLAPEDVVPRELADSRYQRLDDAPVGRTPCYVIESRPLPRAESVYSRVLFYVDQERFVPLRIRYWDAAGVEIKEMRAPARFVREIDGRFLATRWVMRHLREPSVTTLHLDTFAANPEIPRRYFSQDQLVAPRMRLPKHIVGGVRRF